MTASELREKLGAHITEDECPGCVLGDAGPEAHDCGDLHDAGVFLYDVPEQ